MKLDYKTLYAKNFAFYESRPQAKRVVLLLNRILPYLFALSYLLLWVYAYDTVDQREQVTLFFSPVVSLITVTAMQLFCQRPRPYEETGAGITPMLKKSAKGNSFPSRHIACAVAVAMAFIPHLPVVGALLLVFSCLLAYTRFTVGVHYPSDLFVGGGIGLFFGLLPLFF